MRYFNYAGLSPTRAEAVTAMQAVSSEFRTMLFSEFGIAWYRKQVEEYRKKIAQFIHANLGQGADSLLFVSNATTAYKIALSTLALRPGNVVITSDQEHPSTLQALHSLKPQGIELNIIPAGSPGRFVAQLEDACKDNQARLITLSHVACTDGRIFPLQKVCEIAGRRNVVVAIDGAQAVGHIPVDLGTLDVDLYCFSGHKWCAGPMGTGALLITEQYKKRQARGEPGPLMKGDAHDYLDLGTQNIGLIAGLAQACELRQQELPTATTGPSDLRTLLKERLSKMREVEIVEWDGPHAPGILSVSIRNPHIEVSRVAEYLSSKHDIAVKPINSPELPQMLRVSWSSSTEVHDILFLVEKLEEALRAFG
ncbi:MAG: aminotransferase class V-fold PLP-dependent enzyme [Nitrospiraceae bacterium]